MSWVSKVATLQLAALDLDLALKDALQAASTLPPSSAGGLGGTASKMGILELALDEGRPSSMAELPPCCSSPPGLPVLWRGAPGAAVAASAASSADEGG